MNENQFDIHRLSRVFATFEKLMFLSIYLLVLPTSLTSILGRSARRRVTYKRARVGADSGHGEAKIRGKKVTPSVKREVR